MGLSKSQIRERDRLARIEAKEAAAIRRAKRTRLNKAGAVLVAVVALAAGGVILFSGPSKPSTVTSSTTTTTADGAFAGVTAHDRALQAKAAQLAVAAGCPLSSTKRVNTLQWAAAPVMAINPGGTYYAHFVTTAGAFVVQLDAKEAPITVNNFVFLANQHFYNCVLFQRVIPNFMIQGGDPTGTGGGGPGYTIADEYPKKGTPTYPLYSIAMANTGAPHSGGSQFFIVTGAEGEALPPTYTLFGRVVSGYATVRAISNEGNNNDNGEEPTVLNRMLTVSVTTTP